jgi:hypothetical protein
MVFGGGTQNKSGKVGIKHETALRCARLKVREDLHPQDSPLTQGRLQKILEKSMSPVWFGVSAHS